MPYAEFASNDEPVRRLVTKAVLSGCAVALLTLVVWNGLLFFALKETTFLPRAVEIMAAILLVAAAFLRWSPWPRNGRAFRRAGLRFNGVPVSTTLLAMGSGWFTMLAGFLAYVAHRAATGLGGEVPITLPNLPFADMLPALLMGAFVAGSVEEVAFRGFMQGSLERRLGVVPAILISGLVWSVFHTNHSYFGEEAFVWIGIFLAVSAMLGTIAYRTNSVIPGIIVHSGFDAAYFVAAGLLQPAVAPIAYIQSLAAPQSLVEFALAAAMLALLCWIGFVRATRADRGDD